MINNIRFSAIFTIIFLSIVLSVPNISKAQNAPSLSASLNKKSYSQGESGVLTLSFKTSSKVKIPKEPGIDLSLTTNDIEGQGFQDYSEGEGDYISNSKVKYNFTVNSSAASGSYITVSGSVKFGFCTTSDGVCKLATKNFSVKAKIK